MNKSNTKLKNISKFLSYVLRHCPEDINLTLDPEGWATISELIYKSKPKLHLSQELIKQVVISSDKQRFKLSDDELKIRANQGHSIKVDLKFTPQEPPVILYHGTATRFLDSIKQEGLKPGQRHHVHLSSDIETATTVGKRYGKPAILKVSTNIMRQQGFKFFLSENNVWLTEYVPPRFLSVIS